MKKIIFLTLLVLTMLLCLAGCGGKDRPTLTYVVDGEIYHEDVLKKSDELFGNIGKTPVKDGYCFGGWFYDEGTWKKPLNYTELNKTKDNVSLRVYAKWEVVALEFDEENRSYTVTGLLAGAGSEVVIPAKHGDFPITKIAEGAFRANTALTSVAIPDTVTEIGSYAFAECTALSELILPHTVKEIGRGAFSNCVALEKIRLSAALTSIPAEMLLGCGKLTALEIPAAVESIGARAFDGCTALSEIVLPYNVKKLGTEVFRGTTLTEISYKGTAERWATVTRTDFAKNSLITQVRCLGNEVAAP